MNKISSEAIQNDTHQTLRADRIVITLSEKPIRFYRHGWQSWSLTAWTEPSPLPVQKPRIFHPLQVDPVYANNPNPHSSWVGAVEFNDGKILLLGSLALDAHVFLSGDELSGQFEVGAGEWFLALGEEDKVFAQYAEEIATRFGRMKNKAIPRVWCSWYSLYTEIDEGILYEVFNQIGDLPFDVFQVDDGWQTAIGDWIANEKFPSGMNVLAERIKETKRSAGLWLAPLLAVQSSKLFRDQTDWFLRDERGRLVSAGFNWGEQLFALDTTHPGVTEWLSALMKQVRSWGFDYLKLDFLYAGALPGKRYKDMPREMAYREALRVLRDAMGLDAFFLTCGTPILPALGLCDAIRIGPDVADLWEKYRDAVLLSNPSTPGTRNAIRTVVHRLWLKPLVHLDPDAVYFTQKENYLIEEQKVLLQSLALICKFKATSDLPQWMTREDRDRIRTFLMDQPGVRKIDRYKYELNGHLTDFTPAMQLPDPPRGISGLWAALLGWLGSMPLLLKINKSLNDNAIRKRRGGL